MHFIFDGIQLQKTVVAFAILVSTLQCVFSESLGSEYIFMEKTTEKLDAKKHCGVLQISHASKKYEFDVFDRDEVSSCITDILDSPSHEIFDNVRVKKGCEMKICHLHYLNPEIPRETKCLTFTNDTELDYLFVVSASCSCKQPTLKCKEVQCENISLKDDECARLYEEPNCQECRYEHISLTTTSTWIPKNGFFVGSLLVKHGCQVDIGSPFEINKQPTALSFKGIHNYSQLSYVQAPSKSAFTCSCGNIDEEIDERDYRVTLSVSPGNNSTCTIRNLDSGKSPNVTSIVGFAVPFAVVIIVIIVIAMAYLKTLRNIRKLRSKVASEAVERFQAGESDSAVDYPHQENPIYVSFGYFQALKQPYQHKYEIPRNCLLIDETKKLGSGAFGKVLLGKLKTSKPNDSYAGETLIVAVKIAKCSSSVNYFVSLLEEIKILAYIGSHPNVVKMIGACTENIKQGDALILLGYCSNGSLKTYLRSNREIFLKSENLNDVNYVEISVSTGYTVNLISENISPGIIKPEVLLYLYKWAKEILNGMEYLSSLQVVHIDLAARNILLTDDLVAKICDFGLSRRMNDLMNYVKLRTDCPLPFRNMALESLTECRFSTMSDIWSYGVILWELFKLGEDPYGNISNHFELITYLRNNNRLQKPPHSSNKIYNEMLRCWADEPANRPTFTELKTFFEAL